MTDLLIATVVLVLLAATALAVLLALSVAPYARTLHQAGRLRVSATRWGAIALVTIVGSLLTSAHLLIRADQPLRVALPPLVFTWFAPAALSLIGPDSGALGGRVGAHEQPIARPPDTAAPTG